eukprot:CAMPEP_0203900128 /NCGR_PEP_ID=MMETSP0359-20131031/42447_1 /ASSEMBLY_ACC=CAM_ASM_000338 /TAXON_ID=268821 /ORGANISM="Scrippsiella Hangoei, Strain SHTV-5" /LENGTH=42 /DNA_ID= /DNA_START= /DNA_END= /DNA_ORIENTATION=
MFPLLQVEAESTVFFDQHQDAKREFKRTAAETDENGVLLMPL